MTTILLHVYVDIAISRTTIWLDNCIFTCI